MNIFLKICGVELGQNPNCLHVDEIHTVVQAPPLMWLFLLCGTNIGVHLLKSWFSSFNMSINLPLIVPYYMYMYDWSSYAMVYLG